MQFLRLLVAFSCMAVAAGAGAVPYTSLFAFGDSSSDNGRRLLLQGTKPASPPYFMGRHSNGLVAVEHLAAGLGLSGAQFVDYAVGGALSGHGNVDLAPVLANTGLLDQLATFQSGHPIADPAALYFIYGGDNDINECRLATNPCPQAAIEPVVENLVSLVEGLWGLGARHFMVIGSYGGGSDKNLFRSLLGDAMGDLDATLAGDITYFNARPVLLQMIAPGNPYGFTHTSSASPCYTGDLTGGGSVCPDPDTYVFWDTRGHLTAPAHAILGAAMLAAVPVPVSAPATLALLTLGFAGLGMRRRVFR